MSILICYDGSPSAAHAVSVAHQTLDCKDAVLLHVWNPAAKFLADAFSTKDEGSAPSYAELEALSLHRAQEVTDEGRRWRLSTAWMSVCARNPTTPTSGRRSSMLYARWTRN